MRLSVFIAETLSAQLTIDLQKIYADILPVDSLAAELFNSDCTSTLYVTMFNERHIGAVKVVIEKERAVLSHLCVREITRRRGIGKNLLKQIEAELLGSGVTTIQYNLTEVPKQQLLSTQAFFSNSSYRVKNNIALKQLSEG